jgi:hypothetical protein
MTGKKSSSVAKKAPSAWVKHVSKVWAEMGGGKGKKDGPTYKMAMCAASQCWSKKKQARHSKKACGSGEPGTKCADLYPEDVASSSE